MAVREPGILKVADCVVADTLAHFTTLLIDRQNVASLKLADIATPVAVVMPASKTHTRDTRDITRRDYQVEIGVFQRIDAVPIEGSFTEDQLIELAEEIMEWWVDDQQALSAYNDPSSDTVNVVCVGARFADDEPIDVVKRRTSGYIHSIIQLDFRAL